MRLIVLATVLMAGVWHAGCRSKSDSAPPPERNQRSAEKPADAPQPAAAKPQAPQPLYELSEREAGAYIARVHSAEPSLQKRITTIARRNIGQPYQIYLLGESPFEKIDPEPVYCLTKSDCVVFVEHTLAMAMSESWDQFLSVLQRIRYKDGQIGVLTRNHYTEADWNRNNEWLVEDITEEVGGDAVVRWSQKVDRAKFFRDRYKLDTSVAVQTIEESFIPYDQIGSVKSMLREGDVVNFVSGRAGSYWVGHVGLVGIAADGSVNLIHSAAPQVREEPIDQYIARATADAAARDSAGKARFRGFKFLRVVDDPWMNLRVIDGLGAPRVTVPKDSPVTWQQYLDSFAGVK
jgi:hypothetical protein